MALGDDMGTSSGRAVGEVKRRLAPWLTTRTDIGFWRRRTDQRRPIGLP